MFSNHYFINDTADLTAYSLEHYDEVKDIVDFHLIYKKTGKYYNEDKSGNRFIKAFQVFELLNNNIGKLISPMPLTEEIMHTQFYDKVDECKTLDYTKKFLQTKKFEETMNDICNILFDFEAIASESKHMPYLYWLYSDEIQQECIGVNTCAIDMLNSLPTGGNQILLIAHNSDYGCRFILEYLEHVKPIVNGGRFLQIKATCYNPIHPVL